MFALELGEDGELEVEPLGHRLDCEHRVFLGYLCHELRFGDAPHRTAAGLWVGLDERHRIARANRNRCDPGTHASSADDDNALCHVKSPPFATGTRNAWPISAAQWKSRIGAASLRAT